MDVNIVKKNSYEFSAVKEVLSEVNNKDFKAGESDFYSLIEGYAEKDTSKSYIWTAISAIADDVTESIYQNVLNYIDNVSNIDTCSVKALQSMIQIIGTRFSVFDNLKACPVDIMNLINVFSMRRDYLLNSEKVCNQLINVLSSTGSDGILTENGLYPAYIDDQKLDNVISLAYYNVLTAHLNQRYGVQGKTNDIIYKNLSSSILYNGFSIPNPYVDVINNYKTKWNIPSDFDYEHEVDNIDNGISVIEDYTEREQNLLSIEFTRRNSAKYDLEPCSRYAYYKELDVRDYSGFIEDTYNEIVSAYNSSYRYAVDSNYIVIDSLSSKIPLYQEVDNSIGYKEHMVQAVAERLTLITTQIREIREYLKSHSQRTYMKGTFLLISYIVNEYLKNNVFPILPTLGYDESVSFSPDKNKLELVEYVDQTQYNNIHTEIDEDVDDMSLNPEYWNSNGSNGSAILLDTTNIFKPADKMKVVSTSTFSQKEIEDFYVNILNNQTGISRLSSHESIYDFLTTLFKVGADNSYRNENGKVMCELNNFTETSSAEEWYANRRFTKDIDNYISDLSASYARCSYLLNGYQPMPNISYQQQLDEIKAYYDNKAYQVYQNTFQGVQETLQQKLNDYDLAFEQLNMLTDIFTQLTSSFSSLVISNTPNTGDFSFTGSRFIYNLSRYSNFLTTKNVPQKWTIMKHLDMLQTQYNDILSKAFTILKTNKILKTVMLLTPTFDDYNLSALFLLDLHDELTLSAFYVSLHHEDVSVFEQITDELINDMSSIKAQLQGQVSKAILDAQIAITNHKAFARYKELDDLSANLKNFITDQASIFDCVNDISEKLDYTKTDWYQYKEKLFYKYTGLSTSDLPFYYIENVKHPSYQIHPCLSNFIEYVDYSFPIKNLANIAEETISNIAKDTARLLIDDAGYLKDVWNNPLNSNAEYLTKYEKSVHVDEMGNVNKFYGFDGFCYPDINYAPATFQQIISLLDAGNADYQESPEFTVYSGLNLSKYEQKLIAKRLTAFSNLISSYRATKTTITRYGIDIYENSYMLIDGILWFKPKNHPFAFPALVYNHSTSTTTFNEELSEINLNVDSANKYFNELKRKQIGDTNYYSPVFADFTFSTDKTTMLLNGFNSDSGQIYANSIPVIANIVQQYQVEYERQYYLRTFAKDRTVQSLEHLEKPSSMDSICYYYENRHIGQMYAKWEDSGDTHILKIAIAKYFQDNVNAQLKTTRMISGEITPDVLPSTRSLNSFKFSCRSNGSFSIAYIGNQSLTSLNVDTYNGIHCNYKDLSSTIEIFDKPIVSYDFEVLDEEETIMSVGKQMYAPYIDMGFIRLRRSNDNSSSQIWELSSTTFKQDFKAKKVLKFEFDIDQTNEPNVNLNNNAGNLLHGIDFKYICPLRVEELEEDSNTDTTLNIRDDYDNVAFQRAYGKGSLDTEPLKHYAITDLHVFDSLYNDYVYPGHIPEFVDLEEYEQKLFNRDLQTNDDVFTEYTDLMRYDVARYLSSQREELVADSQYSLADYDNFSTIEIVDGKETIIDGMNLVTEPFLVNTEQFYKLADSSYIKGYVNGNNNVDYSGKYRIVLDENVELSAEIMTNDDGETKIDFNPIYYFLPTDYIKAHNTRNKLHLFLNLDKPGDSGYLNVYKNVNTENPDLLATLFIKNISDSIPKFILKALYFDVKADGADLNKQSTFIDAEKESHMFRNKNSNNNAERFTLVDESFVGNPIEFS